MKLHFDSKQEYQLDAIKSITDIFEGQPLSTADFEFAIHTSGTLLSENGFGNHLNLTENQVWKKLYGFKKFVIVVPSVAVREGVLKNLQITHDHFQSLYDKAAINFDIYDSKKVSNLRGFASNNAKQILVINIDSFAKDENIINKPNDKLTGKKPIEFIQSCNPILIVDEPQNMETEIRKRAIYNLNPLCTLRYSATHTNLYNLMYSLNPVKAYDLGLVKQIEVDSVMCEHAIVDSGAC